MGRFTWLEFSGEEKAPPPVPAPEVPGTEELSQEYLNKANGLFLEGLYAKALREYSRVLGEDNGCILAWTRQNICQIALHEHRQAAVWAQKFSEQFPDHPQALSSLALAKSYIPETRDQVEELLERVQHLSSGHLNAQMQFEKGACYLALGEEKSFELLEEFLESLGDDSSRAQWYTSCAALYLDADYPERACALLERQNQSSGLSIYGMALWIKSAWRHGNTGLARALYDELRHRDGSAPERYDIAEYFERVEVKNKKGLAQYIRDGLAGIFGKQH